MSDSTTSGEFGGNFLEEIPPPYRVGVLLEPLEMAVRADGADPPTQFQPASEGGARRGRGRVAAMGETVLTATADAIAGQLGVIAERIGAELDRRSIGSTSPGRLSVESVELPFGLVLTAGAGKIVEAWLTAGGEATAQVSVVLSRRPE